MEDRIQNMCDAAREVNGAFTYISTPFYVALEVINWLSNYALRSLIVMLRNMNGVDALGWMLEGAFRLVLAIVLPGVLQREWFISRCCGYMVGACKQLKLM